MRVLVCGGRDFDDVDLVYQVLDKLHSQIPISCIIEGGARGADSIAAMWSRQRNLAEHSRFEANWSVHGKKAGPIRNQRMLSEGKPDLVIAFPGGRGTADMVARAKKAGIETCEIEAETCR